MTDPIQFSDQSPRFGLPFLRPGQAQKEFFVNQTVALSDMLHHPAVLGEASAPPPAPSVGDMWLVSEAASDAWAGYDGQLAAWQGTQWLFAVARPGMRVFDCSTQSFVLYADGWHRPQAPSSPLGGSNADTELRAAFTSLIETLGEAGIFSVIQ